MIDETLNAPLLESPIENMTLEDIVTQISELKRIIEDSRRHRTYKTYKRYKELLTARDVIIKITENLKTMGG